MKRADWLFAAALAVIASLLIWGGLAHKRAADSEIREAVAERLKEQALDTAAAIRGRLNAHERADSVESAEESDSIAAWRLRAVEAERRAAEARRGAQAASDALRETLTAAQTAQLDTLEAEHAIQVQAVEHERDLALQEVATLRTSEGRARALFAESEAESAALRRALAQAEISGQAKDAIIRSLKVRKVLWQGVAVGTTGVAAAQFLGFIG